MTAGFLSFPAVFIRLFAPNWLELVIFEQLMPALLPVARFYARPFLLLVAVNLLLYLLLGTYFEEYEGFFSTILQGTYTLPGDAWWDTTNHFLILFLYESLIATVRGVGYRFEDEPL